MGSEPERQHAAQRVDHAYTVLDRCAALCMTRARCGPRGARAAASAAYGAAAALAGVARASGLASLAIRGTS